MVYEPRFVVVDCLAKPLTAISDDFFHGSPGPGDRLVLARYFELNLVGITCDLTPPKKRMWYVQLE